VALGAVEEAEAAVEVGEVLQAKEVIYRRITLALI